MEYRRLVTREEVFAGIRLWNREHSGFQIIPGLVEQNIFAPFAGVHNIAWGGFCGDELVAFTLVKYLSQPILNSANSSLGWVSLLVVDRRLQGQEISEEAECNFYQVGRDLLAYAEGDLTQRGVQKIRFGGDPQNFLPGLPEELVEDYQVLLVKSGYQVQGNEYDLHGDLETYTPLKRVQAVEEEMGGEILARPVTKDDEPALLHFLEKNFPGRWYYEADQIRRMPGGVEDYWLLWYQDTAVGFVRTNTSDSVYMGPNVNWGNRFGDRYCGLGPIGIDNTYRGKGFGLYLMEKVIDAFKVRGYRQMMIDWTQLVDYYQKIGFEPVIKYTTLIKELNIKE